MSESVTRTLVGPAKAQADETAASEGFPMASGPLRSLQGFLGIWLPSTFTTVQGLFGHVLWVEPSHQLSAVSAQPLLSVPKCPTNCP